MAGICRDGYTYDITDKICVPYTDEEETQLFMLNVTLIHNKTSIEPYSLQHVAKLLIVPFATSTTSNIYTKQLNALIT